MTLNARSLVPFTRCSKDSIPLSVTIRPANLAPGSFQYRSDSASLLKFLRRHTDLRDDILKYFRSELDRSSRAKLAVIDFKDNELRQIGYFID